MVKKLGLIFSLFLSMILCEYDENDIIFNDIIEREREGTFHFEDYAVNERVEYKNYCEFESELENVVNKVRNRWQSNDDKTETCSAFKCSDYSMYFLRCANPNPVVHPPCRIVKDPNPELFPNCCPKVVCPPYYTALDAYIYTFSLIQSKGQAVLETGTKLPDIKYREVEVIRTASVMMENSAKSVKDFNTAIFFVAVFLMSDIIISV